MTQRSSKNRKFVLAERPRGEPDANTLRLETADPPKAGAGQMLLRNKYLSLDLADDKDSIKLIERFSNSGRPVGAVCHAPAVLKRPKGLDGKPLVNGKAVTGFSNTEEEGVGLTKVVPFLVQDMLVAQGANYKKGDDWGSFVVTDGKLVTGQNPASSRGAAQQLLTLL